MAEYEKAVRDMLSANRCVLCGMGRGTMISGLVLLPDDISL